jgi:hypothetical protein
MPGPTEKLERIHALTSIRFAVRELYFNFDNLSDDEADERLNAIQSSVQNIRAKVQERRANRNGNPSIPEAPIPPKR